MLPSPQSPPRETTYWNVAVSSRDSLVRRLVRPLVSLNLWFAIRKPMRRHLPRNPHSLTVLILLSLEEVKHG